MARWSDVFAMIFAVVACACLLAALAMHGCPDARPAHVPFRSRPSRTSGRPALDGKYDYTWQGGKGVVVIRPQGGWQSEWCGQTWIGWWEEVLLEKGVWRGKLASGGDFEILLPASK